jgi:formylglycine-generating enzyme
LSDIFISYASEDRPRVKPLVDALAKQGWSVWWDRTILPGRSWDQVIEAALSEARCVVVLWSRNSVQSRWVRTEAHEADRRRILVPALIDDASINIPLAFRRIQAANLVGWCGAPTAEFHDLVQAVAAVLSNAASLPADTAARTMAASETTGATLEEPRAQLGQARKNLRDGRTYVWIPPGRFLMGCSLGESECDIDEKPAHEVTITRGFWLGQTPVTQAAYQRVIGSNPSRFKGTNLPVEQVTWEEARAYCAAIGGRLPTEAEWEYAARAGTTGSRYGDLDQIAWHQDNSGSRTHEVAQKQPNAYGLYDMLGNVFQWTADWYGFYTPGAQSDPSGPSNGQGRVLRGGSWLHPPKVLRVSIRGRGVPGDRNFIVGFRCVGHG